MSLLSVIVPVYNAEKTIEKCIGSILYQTYGQLEIIMIDDGSSDQSYKICKAFADRDNRITLLRNKHLGVTATRKAGVAMASGEYTAFVDSDDWIDPYYFERLMDDIEDADVVIAQYYIMEQNEQNEVISVQHLEEGIYFGNEIEDIVEKLLTPRGIDCCLWNKIFKTQWLKTAIGNVNNEIFLFEDLAILLPILIEADKVRITKMAGYHYCVNNSSLIHSIHKDYLLNLHCLFNFIETVLDKCSYKEKLMQGFYRYMQFLIFQSPYYLDLKIRDMEVQFQDIYYPYYGRLENARIILYGAGYIGMSYYYHIKNDKETEIVAWVDRQPQKCRGRDKFDIQSPDVINDAEYDYIILAVREENDAENIKAELVKKSVPENIILWNKTKRMTYVF